jgi:hypothetical protein
VDLKQRLLRGGFAAGVAALGVGAIAAGLSAPPVLVILLAIAAYVAVALTRTRTATEQGDSAADTAERTALAYETSRQKVAAMRKLATEIERESTREIVLRICDHSDRVLETMTERDAQAAAPLYLEQLIEPAEALLETYLRLSSRGLKTTDEILARHESQDFPTIERAARLFLDRLRQEPRPDLASLSQILAFAPETPTSIVQPDRTR